MRTAKSTVAGASLFAFLALLFFQLQALALQDLAPEKLEQLRYRHIGPVGNRISSVAGVAGDPAIYYAGAASGGVWKTTDAGLTWKPMFDDQSAHSIGALAVAPSDSEIIWAGTGEPHIRSNVSIGDGVYKSTDGGKTWKNMGLEESGRVSRVVIHPTNPEVVYVAVLGHGYSPQSERGIYRTQDGGHNWEHVLFVDENTGASDLSMDPANPRIMFAGMWQIDIKTWGRESGGPGSGLYTSRDGGDTWKRLEGNGLPELPVGKVAVCMTSKDSDRIYALIETGDGVPWHGEKTESGELWRSDDGGENWKLVNHSHDLAGRTAYYSRCAASPDNSNEVYFLSSGFSNTLDGGTSSSVQNFPSAPGFDHHDMWIDSSDANRMAVGHDGGVSISENRGKSWLRVQLPVAQLYHVTVDNMVPYNVLGNRQDGPSFRGPSNSRLGAEFGTGGIPRGMWHAVGGGESGFATPDPVDPNIIWSSTSGWGPVSGIVVRYDERRRQFRNVEVWPEASVGWPAKDVKYRFQWTFPLLISPHDNNTVYVSSQFVHRTRNGGQSWEVISPDLTLDDETKQGSSGGLTPDNIGVEYGNVIYALDESPVQKGVLWAGTNDGLVHISRDGGQNWVNITDHIPNLPPLGTIRNIDASKWDAGKAYLTVDFHQIGNFRPYVYKTDDYGQTWASISDGISESTLSYARNIREDPARKGLLYLGTENAIYVSLNDGENWQPLQTNLPHTPVYWIAVQEHFSDLVIGTYGRGFWILDDITPLQQFSKEVEESDAHLFEPRPAYRFRPITELMTMFEDPSAGENPPYGASINYWLKQKPEADVSIEISDSSGRVVRTLKDKSLEGKLKAGINRIWWDLSGELSDEIELRTKPPYSDWVPLGDERTRSGTTGRFSVLVSPGSYTVTLKVGEQELSSSLEVLKDPNTEGSEADILGQTALMEEIHSDMNAVAGSINRIEWIRRQIYDLKSVLESQEDVTDILQSTDELDQALVDIESNLHQMKLTGTGQDSIRWPMKLAGRLLYLAGGVSVGDFPPTDQHRQVQALLHDRVQEQQDALDRLVQGGLKAFNKKLQEGELSGIVVLN
jgi:photosystem II stability/assembly factor-like uncharacterized protein